MMFPKKKRFVSKVNYDKYRQSHNYCELCGSIAVDVHHITPRSQMGGDNDENLIALCRSCHSEAHRDKHSFINKINDLGVKY